MAGMLPAAMAVAAMAVAVFVVITGYIRIEGKGIGQKGVHRRVRVSAYAAEETDAGLLKRHLRSAADPSADKRINALAQKKAGQRAMAATVGINDFRVGYSPVFHLIELELLRVPEMLENGSVIKGNCDFHDILLSEFAEILLTRVKWVHALRSGAFAPVTEAVVAAFNFKRQRTDQRFSQL